MKKFWKQWYSVAAAGLMGMAASSAQAVVAPPPAVNVTVQPTVLVTPGQAQATTTLTYEFLADYNFSTIFLTVDYDKNFLTFNRGASSVSVVGSPDVLPLPTAVALLEGVAGDPVETNDPGLGQYTLNGQTITQSNLLPAGAKLVLHGVFDLTSGFTASTSTNVFITTAVSGPVSDPFQEDRFGSSEAPLTITVSAVPEPETWMLLLGGLGLVAARARRVSKARSAVATTC